MRPAAAGDKARPRRRSRLPTIVVWIAALTALLVAAALVTVLAFIPISLDPAEMVSAGADPWLEAIYAAVAFVGLAITVALGLRLWHSERFRSLGLILVALEVGGAAWACLRVYRDYF